MGPQSGDISRGRRARASREGDAGRARLAVLALLGSILVPLVAAGLRSVLWALAYIAALALAAVGVWWTLAHTGALRALGAALSVTAPVAVLALYATFGMLGPLCCPWACGCWPSRRHGRP